MRAYIIAIGDELLTGRTLDYNSHWIAKRLTSLGIDVVKILVVPDRENDIVDAIKEALDRKINIIVTTGGLGPTPGDITLEAIAKALKLGLELNETALKMVKDRYEQLYSMGYVSSREITKDREKMARIPKGAIPFFNPIGVAPGVLLPINKDQYIISLPGVPSEMMYLLEQVLQNISMKARGLHVRTKEITLEVRDESMFARILNEVNKNYPEVYIKSYPVGFGERVFMRVIAIAKGEDPAKLDKLIEESINYLRIKTQEMSDNL